MVEPQSQLENFEDADRNQKADDDQIRFDERVNELVKQFPLSEMKK